MCDQSQSLPLPRRVPYVAVRGSLKNVMHLPGAWRLRIQTTSFCSFLWIPLAGWFPDADIAVGSATACLTGLNSPPSANAMSALRRLRRFMIRELLSPLPTSSTSATTSALGFAQPGLLFFLSVLSWHHPADHVAGLIRLGLPIRLRHRHRDASALLAESPHICVRQREVYISIAFMTMPDSFLCGRLEAIPRSRALERKPATDPGLFIPTHGVLQTPPHCSKIRQNRPAQSRSLHPR